MQRDGARWRRTRVDASLQWGSNVGPAHTRMFWGLAACRMIACFIALCVLCVWFVFRRGLPVQRLRHVRVT